MAQPRHSAAPPDLCKVLLELRAFPEFYIGFSAMSLVRLLPKGDGHPVLVLPGFLADRASTRHLRWVIRRLGYRVYDWKMGLNLGPVGIMEEAVLERIHEITERNGRKPSIVGWSLGGLYARVIAHTVPESIRSIITLASPIRFPHRSTADRLYDRINHAAVDPGYLQFVAAPPQVPATAIHSRLDGIVNWEACLAEESETSENVRVFGSHMGLCYNPLIYYIVADRLAQPEDGWQRFSYRRAAGILQGAG